jgi:bifunctional UDP-N-acetylglucosamine pyrophosphorylase / glucosamine-1-phosphate N-acetyltransferase
MTVSATTAIVLAAGKGTRMRSEMPKVLHAIAGAPMIAHVLAAVRAAGFGPSSVVIGPDMQVVAEAVQKIDAEAGIFVQQQQRGTADAVLAARPAIEAARGPVLVLYGDTPLLEPETLDAITAALEAGADLVLVGFETADPSGYGRLLLGPDGALAAVREEADASPAEREIGLCNSGVMGFRSGATLLRLLSEIGNDNAKGEYYLTDAAALAAAQGLAVRAVIAPAETLLGVNSRAELAAAEAAMQRRLRDAALAGGATLIAPETVFFSFDTKIGRDVVIEPNVYFGPGVVVADDVRIKSFCHIEGAGIGRGASVGPFARLRPGADLAENAHVGNFVEIKQATIGPGAKVNHLTYIGDANVGRAANIGAGTITCNYDGYAKHRTEIGEGAFIGSNSALVAPVKIGDGAYIGSGSVISKDVSPGALALTRSPQEEVADWAARFRARRAQTKPDGGNNRK